MPRHGAAAWHAHQTVHALDACGRLAGCAFLGGCISLACVHQLAGRVFHVAGSSPLTPPPPHTRTHPHTLARTHTCRLGYKVALLDADIGLRNLDLLLGLENRILYTAIDILEGECRLDQALIRDKRWKNLSLLSISRNRQRCGGAGC